MIAHELAHVRSLDVLTQTFAVLLATTLVELSRLGGYFSRALLFVLGPIASAFTHALLSPRREYAADRDAAASANPHDLADALLRLDRAGELVSFAASPTTEPLYPSTRSSTTGSRGCSRRIRRSPSGCGGCGRWTADAERPTRAGKPDGRPAEAGHRDAQNDERDTLSCVPFLNLIRRRPTLPGARAPSTIGAGGLNFSVRNGKRCTPAAMTAESVKGGTRPARRLEGADRSSVARTFKTP